MATALLGAAVVLAVAVGLALPVLGAGLLASLAVDAHAGRRSRAPA